MPKVAKELSAKAVRDLKTPGMHAAGGVSGLCLQVLPSGAKSWVLRMKIGDKRREIGLGGFPTVTLSEARDLAREARAKVREGIDPVAERQSIKRRLREEQARHLTFTQAFERVAAIKLPEFKSEVHKKQWRASIEQYALPHIGHLPVNEIELRHIEEMLTADDLWTEKPSTASRVRQRVERILDWCTAGGHRTGDNPARWRGGLEARLTAPGKLIRQRKEHYPALPVAEMPTFMADLRESQGMPARCLEFLILTASRSEEARGTRWTEIDFKAGTWTIPKERTKTGRDHRVPLSKDAIAMLRALPREPGDLVFPGNRRNQIGINSMRMVIGRLHAARMAEQEKDGKKPTGYIDPKSGRICTPHGMRSAFRDWAGERSSYPVHIIETALAHAVGDDTMQAYARSDLLEKRRQLMESWAKFCKEGDATPNAVTPIRSQEG